jgi:hypothetical protein
MNLFSKEFNFESIDFESRSQKSELSIYVIKKDGRKKKKRIINLCHELLGSLSCVVTDRLKAEL